MHSMSIRTPKDDVMETNEVLYNFITTFFGCKSCVSHFTRFASGSTTSLAKRKQKRRGHHPVEETIPYDGHDMPSSAIWVWAAHNNVNLRLYPPIHVDGNTTFPLYPTEQSCPKCRQKDGVSEGGTLSMFGILWNMRELHAYLADKYCISGPPDDKYDAISQECHAAAIRWTPLFRRRNTIPPRGAMYIVGAFVACLAVVSVGFIVCANVDIPLPDPVTSGISSIRSIARKAKASWDYPPPLADATSRATGTSSSSSSSAAIIPKMKIKKKKKMKNSDLTVHRRLIPSPSSRSSERPGRQRLPGEGEGSGEYKALARGV
eukprot:CAMPEP_0167783074 /NCGR_PEP_ID=MMETSP0111_2-20121227/6871_1 /TAXON_ID=91324 /ORGANISM="Lotharella globosa, Strain CCCM811" /LENGTH=318 /DNA_ID=CAMNT_0007673977 /DNA_START=315 /DNA_END=1271 /DNA_ORIENTATION=+